MKLSFNRRELCVKPRRTEVDKQQRQELQVGNVRSWAIRVLTARDPVYRHARRGFTLGLELNAPKSRIRDAVGSGFNVACEPIFENRISSDRDDQVVPAVELIQG